MSPAKKSPYKKPDEALSGFPDISVEAIQPDPPKADPGSPFQSSDWRVAAHAWLGLIVRTALVLGAVFSVVQYLNTREETRIARTLALVDDWEKPEYQAAQRALHERLAALNAKYSELLGAKPTDREVAIFQSRIGLESLSAGGGSQPLAEFRADYDRILYFLSRLSACVDGKLCSSAVADDYFRDFAVSFWRYYSAAIEAERKRGQPTYGLAIETYVNSKP